MNRRDFLKLTGVLSIAGAAISPLIFQSQSEAAVSNKLTSDNQVDSHPDRVPVVVVGLDEVGGGDHLLEAPLSKDQKIEMVDGKIQVSATVSDTAQLRWWIMGFGHGVEVISPATLRLEIAKDIKAAAKKY